MTTTNAQQTTMASGSFDFTTLSSSSSSSSSFIELQTLPPFAIHLKSSSSSWTNRIAQVETQVEKVTETFLKEFIRAQLKLNELNDKINGNSTNIIWILKSLELALALENPAIQQNDSEDDDNDFMLIFDVYGTLSLVPSKETSSSLSASSNTEIPLLEWIQRAFGVENILNYRRRLLQSAPTLFQDLTVVTVNSLQDDQNGQFGSTTTTTGEQGRNESTTSHWSVLEYTILAMLIAFICISIGAVIFYVQANRIRQQQKWQARNVPDFDDKEQNTSDDDDDGADEERNGLNPQHFASQQQQQSNFMPYSSNSWWWWYPPSDNRALHTVKPMLSQQQEQQEHEHDYENNAIVPHQQQQQWWWSYLGSNNNNNNNVPPQPPAIMTTTTTTTTTTTMTTTMSSSPTNKNQDKPFVYRDFPRRDGTPCLMYNPSSSPPSANEPVYRTFPQDAPDQKETTVTAATSVTPNKGAVYVMVGNPNDATAVKNNSLHSTSSIDNFVDKLEQLMTLKCRQYQQRLEMERERKQRSLRLRQERRPKQQPTTSMPPVTEINIVKTDTPQVDSPLPNTTGIPTTPTTTPTTLGLPPLRDTPIPSPGSTTNLPSMLDNIASPTVSSPTTPIGVDFVSPMSTASPTAANSPTVLTQGTNNNDEVDNQQPISGGVLT